MTLYPDILTDEDLLPISTAALPNHLYPALPHQPQINQTFSPSASRQSSLSSSQSFGSADTRSTSAASLTQSLSAGSLNQYDQNHNPVNSRASLPINIYYEVSERLLNSTLALDIWLIFGSSSSQSLMTDSITRRNILMTS